MNIKEGLKLKGRPAEIPDCNRADLPQFFVEMGFKKGVEIGVMEGVLSEKFCKAGLKLYAVDPWKTYDNYNEEGLKEKLDKAHKTTKKRLEPYDCEIMKATSMEAVKVFEDESLDFVYIDGYHDFKFVTEDIFEWSKKIKKGGVISGHDYAFNISAPYHFSALHVKYVLPAYTKAYKINNWYVLGRHDKIEGEKRDQFRSWMWIKK